MGAVSWALEGVVGAGPQFALVKGNGLGFSAIVGAREPSCFGSSESVHVRLRRNPLAIKRVLSFMAYLRQILVNWSWAFRVLDKSTGVPKVNLGTGAPNVSLGKGGAEGEARHEGAEGEGNAKGDTKLACCKAMWLGTWVPKATQSLRVARQCGQALGCRRRHKACVSQGNVARHLGAEGITKLACRKAMWPGTWVPKASQSLRVARQCG
ncbi:hypothetical protein ACE6H2_014707 [Prunus campanulata]